VGNVSGPTGRRRPGPFSTAATPLAGDSGASGATNPTALADQVIERGHAANSTPEVTGAIDGEFDRPDQHPMVPIRLLPTERTSWLLSMSLIFS